jgi:molybdate transport system ATP-binding protein
VEKIAVRLREKRFLSDISWSIGRGEQWAILGPNGSGKTTLAKSIFGRVPIVHGEVQYYFSNNGGADLSENLAQIGYVSPDDYRDLIQRNLLEDTFRDFSGRIGEFTPARTLLFEGRNPEKVGPREAKKVLEVAHRMGIGHLLERPLETLSIGESRKFLIARALLREPKLLILDKPFDGLDQKSKQSFEKIIRQLIKDGICLILITNRTEEILRPFTHVLVMQEGKIVASGKKTDILEEGKLSKLAIDDSREIEIDEDLYGSIREASEAMVSGTARELSSAPETLLEMNGVTVKYNRVVVLDNLNWIIKRGENWAILGPNGAGKSTLLKLIFGDNQQAYSNDIVLLGEKRGSGSTIWDIKKHIGVVSTDLQAKYKAETKVFDLICSGFYDSVGLYRRCSELEKKAAYSWLKLANLEAFAFERFDQLSYGQRQLTLILRAIVKNPLLLILDEPCDGLDHRNRATVLKLINFIGNNTGSTVIVTTHREDEIPECVQNVLWLRRGKVIEICRRTPESACEAVNSFGLSDERL